MAVDLRLTPGSKLLYDMADFDRADKYQFLIKALGPSFEFDWSLCGCSDHGSVSIGPGALRHGRAVLAAFDGDVTTDTEVPVFLLSRDAFRVLKETRSLNLRVQFANSDADLALEGVDTLPLRINGGTVRVRAVHAAGEDDEGNDLSLWIADNPELPIILKREECGGDNYWSLLEASVA